MAVNGTANGTGAETIAGTVEALNERGVKVGGRWLNVSQWHPIELPRRGELVRIRVDGKGYIKAVESGGADTVDPHHGPVAGRETAIIRQTCLKAAAEFCAARPELNSADLLALAERMEVWVTR